MFLRFSNLIFVLNLITTSWLFTIIVAEHLPSTFTKCTSEPKEKFDACLNKAIELGLKLLEPGIPELNIPSLDPLAVKTFVIGEGKGAVHLVQHYSNMNVSGFSKATVNETQFIKNKKVLKFTTFHPQIIQKATYKINGKIMVLAVYGNGDSVTTLDGVTIRNIIHFEETKQNNEIFYIPKTYIVKVTMSHGNCQFSNLFDGNKVMSDNIHAVINQEWKALFDDVKDGIEKGYAAFLMDYMKLVFTQIPAKELFLL